MKPDETDFRQQLRIKEDNKEIRCICKSGRLSVLLHMKIMLLVDNDTNNR